MALWPHISPWQFLKKLFKRISDNDAGGRAAQLSYYFVFALFPFLFFLVTLAAYLPIQGALEGMLARIDPLVPEQAMSLVRGQLTALTTRQRPHLLTLGLALSLWSASRGVDALRAAMNLSYDVKESRPWWKVQGIAVVVTVATSVLMLLAVLAITLGTGAGIWLATKLHVDHFWPLLWGWLRWPVTAVGIMLVLALLYYFLPDVKQDWRFITPGSVIGTVLWLLLAWGFSDLRGELRQLRQDVRRHRRRDRAHDLVLHQRVRLHPRRRDQRALRARLPRRQGRGGTRARRGAAAPGGAPQRRRARRRQDRRGSGPDAQARPLGPFPQIAGIGGPGQSVGERPINP